MEIECNVLDQDKNIVIIKVTGQITTPSLDILEKQLATYIGGQPVRLILDLQNARSIDSQGVGLLIKTRYDIVNNAGKIVLSGLTDRVSSILRISGLEDYFLIALSNEKALELLD